MYKLSACLFSVISIKLARHVSCRATSEPERRADDRTQQKRESGIDAHYPSVQQTSGVTTALRPSLLLQIYDLESNYLSAEYSQMGTVLKVGRLAGGCVRRPSSSKAKNLSPVADTRIFKQSLTLSPLVEHTFSSKA